MFCFHPWPNLPSLSCTRILALSLMCCIAAVATAQNNPKPTRKQAKATAVKAAAKKYMGRREMRKWDWKQVSILRRNDTGAIFAHIVWPKDYSLPDLTYLMAHFKGSSLSELTRHQIAFADSTTRLQPTSIISTSYICPATAVVYLQPDQSSLSFVCKDSCADRKRHFATIIRGIYKNNKAVPVTPTIYFRTQGAFSQLPVICADSFASPAAWIDGWDNLLSPARIFENRRQHHGHH